MTQRTSFTLTVAAAAAILLLLGCATGPASNTVASQCQSKWVDAGNNGAKADRNYHSDCQ
jgi:hypothetical protein